MSRLTAHPDLVPDPTCFAAVLAGKTPRVRRHADLIRPFIIMRALIHVRLATRSHPLASAVFQLARPGESDRSSFHLAGTMVSPFGSASLEKKYSTMFTQSHAFSLPLPSPFNKAPPSVPGDLVPRADTINQYVIQVTIPSSEAATPLVEIPTANPRRSGKAKASIMIWAGIGRLKQSRATTNGNGNGQVEMNAYEKALAEEMDGSDGSEVAQQFEGSRKLGEDWACAIPTTLVSGHHCPASVARDTDLRAPSSG